MSLRHVDINILDATNLYLHTEDMDVQCKIQADDYHTHFLSHLKLSDHVDTTALSFSLPETHSQGCN